MSVNPHLSNYIRFFQILGELEQDLQISQKEKHLLKVSLTLKDYQLINMIAINQDADDEEFKYSVINYLRSKNAQMTQRPTQKIRCKSTGMDMSPLRLIRRNSQIKEVRVNEEQLTRQIEDLNDSLINILQGDNKQLLNQMMNEKLRTISELINKTATNTPINSSKQFGCSTSKMVDRIEQLYGSMKRQFNEYIKSHILLMDECLSIDNLYSVLRLFVKNLVDADQMSFITHKDNDDVEMFSTVDSVFKQYPLNQKVIQELLLIQPNKVLLLEQDNNFYPAISELFNIGEYRRTYLLRINDSDQYICFHQCSQQKESVINEFLGLVDEYCFFDELNQLALFIVETIKQARVQSFTPLQISHMIQDIGIAFIKCSKYLFIHQIVEILQSKFHVDKHISEILSGQSSPSQYSTSNQSMANKQQVEIDFKDSLFISITVYSMDLAKPDDFILYKEVTNKFNKYLKFIKECFDRTAYYKFFVKSRDSLIFEFDKKGLITFVSRPIPQALKDEYCIQFNPQQFQASYTQIFKNPNLIKHIQNYLQDQNQWKLSESNAQYEVFMKMEEKSFKGFVVIFQQGWFRYDEQHLENFEQALQNKLKKQLMHQQTLNYLDKLEESNPQIRNSVVQMFKPRSAQRPSQFKFQSPKHLEQRNSVEMISDPKISEPKQRQTLNFQQIAIECTVANIDNFEFDILTLGDNTLEKQRIVISILLRNKFIEYFNIPKQEMCEFLSTLEHKYNKKSNPFHNYDHGVAVMQNTHAICIQILDTKYKDILPMLNKFAVIIGALCHDVAHTGRTNVFEMNSLSNLAIRYHDKSVLEQHHAATAIKMLCQSDTNLVANLTSEDFRKFRKMFVNNIFYTDITEHFNLIKNFEARAADLSFGEQDDDLKLLTGMIIHTSDFAGGAKPFQQSKEWSIRVNKEFEAQYNLEGKLGYPQLPYMKDLDKIHVMAKQEVGFFKFIVRPLWSAMSSFLDNKLQVCVDNLDDTIVQWDKIATDVQ